MPVNDSRADIERRMRLLELADGILPTAMKLDEWVCTGLIVQDDPKATDQALLNAQQQVVDGLKIANFFQRKTDGSDHP